jgi:hypothetical protein
MVGSGNRLKTDMRVDRDSLSPGTVLDDLDQIRELAAQARNPQEAHTKRASRYRGEPSPMRLSWPTLGDTEEPGRYDYSWYPKRKE